MGNIWFIICILAGLGLFYVLFRFLRDKSKMLEQDSSVIFVMTYVVLSTVVYVGLMIYLIAYGIAGLVGLI